MKYNSKKHNIKRTVSQEVKNKIRIERQKIRNKLIDERIVLQRRSEYFLKKIRNESTEWELMTQAGDIPYELQYKSWKIVFEKMDLRILPYISVNILFRNVEDTEDDGIIFQHMYENIFYEIEDLTESEIIKRVTLHASIYVGENFEVNLPPAPYEARLLIDVINPNLYQ